MLVLKVGDGRYYTENPRPNDFTEKWTEDIDRARRFNSAELIGFLTVQDHEWSNTKIVKIEPVDTPQFREVETL